MIDLRSDTVTRPTPAMRDAMFRAPVGDDVYGEDPSINALEEQVAARLGKDAALFVPSGCMANQIAVRLHCRPGDELLCETNSHVVLWEAGGPAALSGVTCRTLDGEHGILSLARLENELRPDDVHTPATKCVWLENTHNRGGGRIHSLASVAEICTWAHANSVSTHLDGARLWNAAVATGVPPAEWASHFDTVSVCFSKGLGAPVGSALVGPHALIRQARRVRKLFGGAMRQAGFLAAACSFALDHHIERLADDHANARLIADAARDHELLRLNPEQVDTNVVWVEVAPKLGTARDVADRLKSRGILVAALGEQMLRFVTHLDVSRAECEQAATELRRLCLVSRPFTATSISDKLSSRYRVLKCLRRVLASQCRCPLRSTSKRNSQQELHSEA